MLPPLAPDQALVERCLRAAFPAARLTGWATLPGGLVNTNVRLAFDTPPQHAILRLHQRGCDAARTEAAVNRLIDGHVPHAAILHEGAGDTPPWSLIELVSGDRLDRLAADLGAPDLRRIARAVGRVLAGVHAIRLPRTGFFGPDLSISPTDMDAAGLRAYVDRTVRHGRAGSRFGPELAARLLAHVDAHAGRLDAWADAACLVHGDCNPTNIIVRSGPRGWDVAAVLDWEYALSAFPPLDVGTLLRPPLGRLDAFTGGLAEGYAEAGGRLPADWRRIALLADMFAWADLLGRPTEDPAQIADARGAVAELLDAEGRG